MVLPERRRTGGGGRMNKAQVWKVMITFDKNKPLYRIYRNVDGERREIKNLVLYSQRAAQDLADELNRREAMQDECG